MYNAVMCTLSLYDVIGITRNLHIKLKSFSNIAQPLHKEAVRDCSFLYIIAKKSVIMSEAFLVDVSIQINLIQRRENTFEGELAYFFEDELILGIFSSTEPLAHGELL